MRFLKISFVVLILTAMLPAPGLRAESSNSLTQEEDLLKQIEELKDLKARDPDAYLKVVQEKRAHLKQEFQALKEKDPEGFQQFLQNRQEVKRKRFEYVRQHHPQAYQYFVNRRMERIHNMAETQPEHFQELLASHPQFQERYKNYLQKQNPPDQAAAKALRPPYGEGPYPHRRPAVRRLEQVQNQNPEAFQQTMENHPRLQRRYERYQDRRQGGDK